MLYIKRPIGSQVIQHLVAVLRNVNIVNRPICGLPNFDQTYNIDELQHGGVIMFATHREVYVVQNLINGHEALVCQGTPT